MQVVVRFSGPLRVLAGCPELTVSLADGAVLRDLLRALRPVLPVPFAEQVIAPLEADAGPLALVLVNRVHLGGEDGLERPLAEGDVVVFAPPMAGG